MGQPIKKKPNLELNGDSLPMYSQSVQRHDLPYLTRILFWGCALLKNHMMCFRRICIGSKLMNINWAIFDLKCWTSITVFARWNCTWKTINKINFKWEIKSKTYCAILDCHGLMTFQVKISYIKVMKKSDHSINILGQIIYFCDDTSLSRYKQSVFI